MTGSSSGMGFYCAEALAQRGAHVIVAARSLERCDAAAQKIRVCKLIMSVCKMTWLLQVAADGLALGLCIMS